MLSVFIMVLFLGFYKFVIKIFQVCVVNNKFLIFLENNFVELYIRYGLYFFNYLVSKIKLVDLEKI